MIGLALEGGGARGAAHAGVLKALEEEGLRPGAVAGTSAGSLVAMAYALNGEYAEVDALLRQAQRLGGRLLDVNVRGIVGGAFELLTHKNFRMLGIFKGKRLYKWIDAFTRGAPMADAALPIVIPAVDLLSGDIVAFASQKAAYPGDYRWVTQHTFSRAVRASCAIPIAFVPCAGRGEMLVDGGVLENLPVRSLLALGAHKVLGVQIDVEEGEKSPPDDVIGIGIRTIQVMQKRLLQYEENAATALLRVILPIGSGLFAMDRLEEYAQYGYAAAKEAMPRIRRFFRRQAA